MPLAQGWRNNQLGHLSTYGLGTAVTEDLLCRRIELGDEPLMINGDDAVKCCLQDRPFAGLALTHRSFSPLTLDELPDLAADGGHHRKQRFVGLPDLAA